MKKTIDVSYDKCYAECVLDAYFPRIQSHETIIYFHGGGLDSGKKDAPYLVEIAERFVSSGYGFVSVEYRKYPNAKFPSFIHDAAKSIAFVKNTYGDRFGLIVSGSSAGA